MKAGPTTSIARVHAFGQYVAARTSFRVSDLELTAALAAVKLHPEQATTKLSPVVTRPVNPKKPHARPGPMPVGPKCISSYATYGTCPKSCVFMREDSGVKRGCSVDGNVNQLRGVGPLDEAARVLAGHRQCRGRFAILRGAPGAESIGHRVGTPR